MNPTHRTRRLSVTLAGLAAAALALPACQATATAASHRPHHHAAEATVRPAQNSLTFADLHDLATLKLGLFQRIAQQAHAGLPLADLHGLDNLK
jgi:hypothetical protein